MTIPPAFLDEIRARVALGAVVGRRVKLTRAGREMKGCCPFHNEKTPSFYVNEDKGFYHCFGCGAHGDVIRFVVEQDGLAFRDAVEALASEAGLAMPEETPQARARAQAAAGLHEVTARAAEWFAGQLAAAGGAAARDYLAKRGLQPTTARGFGLGFAPDSRSGLKTALAEIPPAQLVETGLLIQPEGDAAPYDRFRGRLMFPIRDPRGRVVGFGGRLLGPGEPKYLNSPDTPLFDKGRLLYNLDRAGPLARKSGRLIVVEGYMDAIALAEAGLGEAVAPLGTALTEAQLALAWRYVPEPVLCFDGDGAGERAAIRAALRALPLLGAGKSLRFAALPAGQDPDDLVRSKGAAAMLALLDAAEPLIDKLWRSETEGVDLATPERRAGARQRLRDHVATIADASVRALYDAELRARFDAAFLPRRSDRPWTPGTARLAPLAGASIALKALGTKPRGDDELAILLVGLLEHPGIADLHGETVAELAAPSPTLARLRDAVLGVLAASPDLDKAGLGHNLAISGFGPALDSLRRAHRLGLSFTKAGTDPDVAAHDFGAYAHAVLARRRIDAGLEAATARLRNSLSDGDFAAQQALLGERLRIEGELADLAARLRARDGTE